MKVINMNSKKVIEEKLIQFIEGRSEIAFAYLFGSVITSEKYNDIDIALFVKPGFNFKDSNSFPYGYEAEVTGKLNLVLKTDKIDVILLNKADLLISTQVYNTGKLIFERDRLFRVKIENSARKEYIDTNHYRKLKEKKLASLLNVR